jgi:cbb3-type cytochrome oxidase subunit 3
MSPLHLSRQQISTRALTTPPRGQQSKPESKDLNMERKMSSTPTGTAGEGSSFSFNDDNQNIQWPPLSIIGIVVTVLGFIAVTWFIFWIFRREKSQRRRATAGTCPLAATNLCKPSRLEAESTDISQTFVNNSPCQCFTDTARRTGDWKPDA